MSICKKESNLVIFYSHKNTTTRWSKRAKLERTNRKRTKKKTQI